MATRAADRRRGSRNRRRVRCRVGRPRRHVRSDPWVRCGALVLAASAAVAIGRFAPLRAAHAVVGAAAAMLLAGVIASAAGAFAPIAGFAAAAVAGLTVLVGAHLRRDTDEGVALEVTGVA